MKTNGTKIPATVITGFLGAGKTTLIRHLLETAGGRRIALIINEFGDLGVDRSLIEGCAIEGCRDGDVIELTNGCICCTVADDFLPTMEMLLDRDDPPDHIVIETSGLALPKPLIQAFNWPEVRARVTVDGVITVVDGAAVSAGRFADDPDAVAAARAEAARAQNEGRNYAAHAEDAGLDHDSPLEELFEDQLRCADLVILNKTDLLDAAAIDAVGAAIAAGAGRAVRAIPAIEGRVDPRLVLGLAAAVEDVIEQRRSHHDQEEDHDHDEFESFVLEFGAVSDPDAFEARLRQAAERHDILRIKGFLDVPGRDRRHVVQGVGARIARYYDRPWRADEKRLSALVVIGQRGLDRAAIETALKG